MVMSEVTTNHNICLGQHATTLKFGVCVEGLANAD